MKYFVASERKGTMVMLAVLSACLYAAAAYVSRQVPQPLLSQKLATSRRMYEAQRILLAMRSKLKAPVSPDDKLKTGWIGESVSGLTTEPGSLKAKVSTTNPNFGAAIVQMLADAGIKKNDVVAVGMSGSFPALNAAVIAAAEELGARPIVISSVGASQWGANQPGFTWLQIEEALLAGGVIRHGSVATGTGGSQGLDPVVIQNLENEARASHAKRIDDMDLARSVRERLKVYERESKGQKIALFVNIGGAAANVGVPISINPLVVQGVMGAMRNQGVPVIDLRQIKTLCMRYNLPWDPNPLPQVGQGALYSKRQRSPILVGGCLVVLAVALWAVIVGRLPGIRRQPLELGEFINPEVDSTRRT